MDRTEHFRGRLWVGDHVLLDHVEGFLKSKPKPNSPNGEWTGHFELPPESRSQFEEGTRYRLCLIDGRSGHIHLMIKDEAPDEPAKANFHGLGSVRR